MKRYIKKGIGLFLTLVLIVTSLSFSGWGIEEAQAANTEYETIAHTTGNENSGWEYGSERGTDLGSVSSLEKGFTFWMTNPGQSGYSGSAKMGFFGTTQNNVWSGGYMLIIRGSGDGTIGLAVRTGVGEKLMAIPNDITGYTEEKLLISTWLTDVNESAGSHTVHIAVNGEEIYSFYNDGNYQYSNDSGTESWASLDVGPYMSIYNEWNQSMSYVSVYEDILSASGQESITCANNTGATLAQVSGTSSVFKFSVSCPPPGGTQLKMGLYNTQANSPNADGYYLSIQPRSTEGTVGFAVREGTNEGNLKWFSNADWVITDGYIHVTVWIDDGQLHLTINGTKIGNWGPADSSSFVLGNYMTIYNDNTGADAVIYSADSIDSNDDPLANYPDIPTNITFEDLGVTAGINSTVAAKANGTNLGQLSSKNVGFKFKITRPTSQVSGMIKIGLYNTESTNPWGDGYILSIVAKGVEGTVDFAVRKGSDETLIAYPGEIAGLTGENLDIYAWIEGDTFYIGLNGKVLTSWTNDGSVDVGTYLCAYSELSIDPTIWTFTEVNDDPLENYPDIPTNITFEDLGVTAGINSTVAAKANGTNLGQLSSKNVGFKFKITRPTAQVSGMIKIGLYNTASTNPWGNGYILNIGARGVEGTVDFAVRKGSDETLIAYPGEIAGLTGENLDIYAWIEGDTFYIGLNGKVLTSWTNDGSVDVGTYLCAYNELSIDPTIWTFTEVDDEPLSGYQDIPTNITFEDLGVTAGINSTVAAKGSGTNLGQLSSKNVGFKFKITRPASQVSGIIKIGLYNTVSTNPWGDGYILIIGAKGVERTVDFAVRKGSDETLIAYPGEIGGLTGESLDIYAWIEGNTFYIGLNGKVLTSWTNDGSVDVGTYLCAYNELSINPTIWTFTEVDDDPFAKYPDAPKNIKYEDIGKTKQKNQISASKAVGADLGKLSSTNVGFKFKLEVPKATNTSEIMKIGVYNTQQYNPWTDGFLITISTKPSQGTLDFAIRKGIDETLISYSGEFQDLGKEITVLTWIEKDVFYLAVNDKVIASWENDGSVKVGTYITVYNEWSVPAVFKTINEVDENASLVPDTSGNITFMDLGQTARKNSIELGAAQGSTLGQLSSVKNGFKFKITPVDNSELLSVKIGLYNTKINNPWTDGYLLIFSGMETKGNISVCLRKGIDEMLIALPEPLTDINGDIDVEVWLTDVDAANGAHTFHAKINGKEIITYTNQDGSVLIGTHLSAYNERKQHIFIKTYTIVDENAFPAPPDTSGDVKFQDIGKTVKSNEVNCADKSGANLGKVSSIEHGFIFKMTTPGVEDAGKMVKIGLYNLEKKNPWTDGYILCIAAKEKEGVLDFALRKGKDEMLLCYPGEFSGFDEETITIKAWLTDTEAKGNAHTIHVSINGVEYLTYTNEDGSVQIGTYMSAYNDGMQTLTFYAMEKIMEPSDLYLQRFGDPTDVDGVCRVKVSESDETQGDEIEGTLPDHSKILVAGVASLAGIAILVALVLILLKNKKRQ